MGWGAGLREEEGYEDGMVFIYRGHATDFFNDAPTQVLRGPNAGNFGEGLAICDFNGDGALDLAIGAPYARQNEIGEGAIHIYLQGPQGVGDQPDLTIFGKTPDGQGGFASVLNLFFGRAFSAADVNGDGRLRVEKKQRPVSKRRRAVASSHSEAGDQLPRFEKT